MATNDSLIIGTQVAEAIPKLYISDVHYYKIGIGLVDHYIISVMAVTQYFLQHKALTQTGICDGIC